MSDIYDKRFGEHSTITVSADGKTMSGDWIPEEKEGWGSPSLQGREIPQWEMDNIDGVTIHGEEVPDFSNSDWGQRGQKWFREARYHNNDGIRKIILDLPDAKRLWGNFHFQIYCDTFVLNAPNVREIDEKTFRFVGNYIEGGMKEFKVNLPKITKLHRTFTDCGFRVFEGTFPRVDSVIEPFHSCSKLEYANLDCPNATSLKQVFYDTTRLKVGKVRGKTATEIWIGVNYTPYTAHKQSFFYVRRLNRTGKITDINWMDSHLNRKELPTPRTYGGENDYMGNLGKGCFGTSRTVFAAAIDKVVYDNPSYMSVLAEFATDITAFNIV